MRLIDADELYKYCDVKETKDGLYIKSSNILTPYFIESLPTINAVPVNELLRLRDWLYESDGITMGGLRSLNELIAKCSNNPLPRIENGFERR